VNVPRRTARQIVTAATQQDPSIEPAVAEQIALTCIAIMDEDPTAAPNEIARRCLAEHGDADVSWINHIARVAASLS
jgi:hypothetical protein